jgi:formamidopyrimidine-DNA glycosylase
VPELPEVETVRRRLAPHLEGRRIAAARIDDVRLTAPAPPDAVARELEGDALDRLDRRGKYLVARLASGRALVVHLRMTGNLLWTAPGAEAGPLPAQRAELVLDDGSRLRYTDVRRFGTWLLTPAGEPSPADRYLDERLGPEPLGATWTARRLRAALARREAPVKSALLDQLVVAGLGNIYVDEALWRAAIHPRTPARRVRGARLDALHRAIGEVLREGIDAQGASIRDYRTPDGGRGQAQERFSAYGRAGEPCPRCGTPIERTVVAQRGTHLCPRCQRPPRGAAGASGVRRRR